MAVTPKRRWLQFRLKTLLLLLTASAVCTWFINLAHEQREAVRVLREDYPNAEILYEGDEGLWDDEPLYEPGPGRLMMNLGRIFEQPPGRFQSFDDDDEAGGIRKFQNWLGKDYFRTVMAVDYSGGEDSRVSVQEWRAISRLPYLRGLVLDGLDSLRDEDLAWLANSTSLERLFLGWTSLGDQGLQKLAGLTNLRYLGLEGTKVTDAGLVHLQNLSRLEMLVLRDTAVTDAGLRHLRLLKGPTTIYLSGTKVTEQGAKDLQAALPNCKVSLVPPVNCPIAEYKGPPLGGFF